MSYQKHLLLLVLSLLSLHLYAQDLWTDQAQKQALQTIEQYALPDHYRLLTLDEKKLHKVLTSAPCIDLPLPDGTLAPFQITPSNILPPDLVAKYPDIKTYQGYSLDNPKHTMRLTYTPSGFHAMGRNSEGTFFIDKVKAGNQSRYISYLAKDEVRQPFTCHVEEQPSKKIQQNLAGTTIGEGLRTLRIAVAFNGELTDSYASISEAMDRVVVIVSDLNVIFERDLCLTFTLAANNDQLLFTSATDPYNGSYLDPNTGITNDIIGVDNYDIGLVVLPGGGGLSYVGVSCGGSKAGTLSVNSVLYIAHELGHNMAAGHTMNHCPGGGYNDYEPGSGNTLMGYAGLCGPSNMPGGDIYQFHVSSFDEMYNRLYNGGGNCAAVTPTGNTPPTAIAGTGGFYIPKSTPFTLTGAGSDSESPNSLTYLWEEYDYGDGAPPWAPTGNNPVFRVYPISDSPSRTFPELSKIINGTTDQGELLPNYSREFNFRFSVRDNQPGGSGVTYDDLQFFVDGNAGPFLVNQPNDNTTIWSVGQTRNVTWNTANTENFPVNAATVNLLLSTDGGLTYPITLASNVANNGTASVLVPNEVGSQNRIKVKAADNIFFDISDEDFEIVDATAYDFTPTMNNYNQSICNENTAFYEINLQALGTFTADLDLNLTGLPAGATSNLPATTSLLNAPTLAIGNLNTVTPGLYPMTLTLTESGGSLVKTIDFQLVVKGTAGDLPGNSMSFDGSSYVSIPKTGQDYNFGADKDFSIEFWFKTTSTAGDVAILSDKNWDSGRNKGWVFALQSGSIGFNMGDGTNRLDMGSGAGFNDGEWHHVALSLNRDFGGKAKLYLDGELKTENYFAVNDISNNLNIGIGADGNGNWHYEGQVEEVRIWNKAKSITEIREQMHRTIPTCETALISCFQFNENTGDAIDPVSFYTGTLNGATRIISTAPIGPGTANSQVEIAGQLNFLTTDFSATYNLQAAAPVTATKINLSPYGTTGIATADIPLDNQYWVVNRFESTDTVNMSTTFTFSEDITPAPSEFVPQLLLYHRSFNSDAAWNFIGYPDNIDVVNKQATFPNIPVYGQYLLTKNNEAEIYLIEQVVDFGLQITNSPSAVQSYTLSANGTTDVINVTAPDGFEISTNPLSGFTSNLSFPPSNNQLANTTIYVRFNPSEEQVYMGEITHSSTGLTTQTISVSGTGKALARTAGMALESGSDGYLSLPRNPDLIFDETEDFTVEFWIYTESTSDDPALISNKNWNSGNNVGWGLFYRGSDWKININASGGSRVDANSQAPAINDGRWHHLAVVFDRDSMASLYQDGFLVNETSIASLHGLNIDPGYPINILQDGTGTYGVKLDAKMDEIRIWNTIRTTQQIRENMHLTLEKAETGLLAYYQFKETADDAFDLIGNHAATFGGTAIRTISDVPAAAGVSVTQDVQANQYYDFSAGGKDARMGLSFTGTTAPEGDVVVSYLTGEGPHGPAPANGTADFYWIVNNYGPNNSSYDMTMRCPDGWASNPDPLAYQLHERHTKSTSTEAWTTLGNLVVAPTADEFSYAALSNYAQFVLSRGGVQLSAKIFLQGPYTAGLMNDNLRTVGAIPLTEPYAANNEQTTSDILGLSGNDAIVDWVLIELRDPVTPSIVLHTRSALLQRDGDIVEVDGSSPVLFEAAPASTYYLAIRARNHLPVMLASPIMLDNQAITIDFTNGSQAIYASTPLTTVEPNIQALYSGDTNADGVVDAADRSETWNGRNQSGYLLYDVNMDGVCDAADRSVTWNGRNRSGILP